MVSSLANGIKTPRERKITSRPAVQTILRFTVTGMLLGLLMGWLFSLVSGNLFIVLFGGSVGTLVGMILGIVHRNDT